MSIDAPADGASVSSSGFLLAGWALDLGAHDGSSGVDAVHVWAYPDSGAAPQFVTAVPYGAVREDVGAAFGSAFRPSGYGTHLTSLAPGGYALVVYAHSTVTGTFNDAKVVRVTVAAPVSMPYIAIDTPRPGDAGAGAFLLAGWAADLASASGTGVDAIHVWAYPLSGPGTPIFAGTGALGWTRADIGAAFGAQFSASGYGVIVSGLPPGSYRLVAYAHSVLTGTFNASASVDVVVR
jgi:hypothetical protein